MNDAVEARFGPERALGPIRHHADIQAAWERQDFLEAARLIELQRIVDRRLRRLLVVSTGVP